MSSSQGGYFLPEVSYIDVPKKGIFWAIVRMIGRMFYHFGLWVGMFGFSKKEIRPRDELIKIMKAAKMEIK